MTRCQHRRGGAAPLEDDAARRAQRRRRPRATGRRRTPRGRSRSGRSCTSLCGNFSRKSHFSVNLLASEVIRTAPLFLSLSVFPQHLRFVDNDKNLKNLPFFRFSYKLLETFLDVNVRWDPFPSTYGTASIGTGFNSQNVNVFVTGVDPLPLVLI